MSDREPIPPATRPLTGDDGQDNAYAAAGGGMIVLALVRGLRSSGWTRTASLAIVVAAVLGLVALVVTALF